MDPAAGSGQGKNADFQFLAAAECTRGLLLLLSDPMPESSHAPADQPERHRYVVVDPETRGYYKVVSRAPRTEQEINELVAGVIRDEGRVKAGVTRTIFI